MILGQLGQSSVQGPQGVELLGAYGAGDNPSHAINAGEPCGAGGYLGHASDAEGNVWECAGEHTRDGDMLGQACTLAAVFWPPLHTLEGHRWVLSRLVLVLHPLLSVYALWMGTGPH